MKAEKVSAPRLMIYRLLVDGLGPGAGMSASSVHETLTARGMTISRARVYQHVNALKKSGYIREIRGTRSPALYERGRNAPVLDDLAAATCQPLDNSPLGGVPDVQKWCQGDNNALNTPTAEVYIPAAETHIAGRYIFPVLKVGELYEPFIVREGGEISEVQVFNTVPKTLKNGVTYYPGTVETDDGIVKIQYWTSPGQGAMHIWPRPVVLLPGRAAESREELAERAQDVANWLGKFGGWRFGLPTFVPNEKGENGGYHYATNDKAIMDQLPPDFQPAAETGWRIDSTPGPRALETNDEANINALLNIGPITRELRQTQEALARDMAAFQTSTGTNLAVLNERSEQLAQITANLQISMENLANASASLIEMHAREAMIKAEALTRDNGGMFA